VTNTGEIEKWRQTVGMPEAEIIYAHIQPNVSKSENYALFLDVFRGTFAYM